MIGAKLALKVEKRKKSKYLKMKKNYFSFFIRVSEPIHLTHQPVVG